MDCEAWVPHPQPKRPRAVLTDAEEALLRFLAGFAKWLAGVALMFGSLYLVYLILNPRPNRPPGPPGWDDLILCSEQTSLDSKKTLSLNEDFTAKLSDASASGDAATAEGHWSLIDPGQHSYRIDVPGAVGIYFIVSPADAEGCILASGPLDRVDLRRSWFSRHLDVPDDSPDYQP